MNIHDYIAKHTTHLPPSEPKFDADMIFFKMRKSETVNKEELLKLIKGHKGVFNDIDLFDGKEHSFIEIGAWLGEQGTALLLMGLGHSLGIWKLLTPRGMLGNLVDERTIKTMARSGMVTIIKRSEDVSTI